VIGGSLLLLILLQLLVVRATITRSLDPVNQLAAGMRDIDIEGLQQRIELDRDWVELRPIMNQFQQLLERLQHGYAREKQTTANIVHELRTPVAEIRSLTQVAARWPDDRKLQHEFLPLIIATTERMEHTIETFLRLARAEAGTVALHPATVPLQPLIQHSFDALHRTGDAQSKTLLNQLPIGIAVHCDHDLVAGIVDNLLSNAISYSPAAAELICAGGGPDSASMPGAWHWRFAATTRPSPPVPRR